MTSQDNQKDFDTITLHWDHSASTTSDIEKNIRNDQHIKLNLDEYFNFLDQVRPHIDELRRTSIFKKPFTLV
jgi:hypothetical protein